MPLRVSSVFLRRSICALIAFAAIPSRADTTVTVTQRTPLESVSAAWEITGVSEAKVGAQYTLVTAKNGQLILKDAQGNQFEIAAVATDYTPPPPAAATNAVAQTSVPATTNAAAAPAPNATSNVTAASTNAAPTVATTTNAPVPPASNVRPTVPIASVAAPKTSSVSFTDVNAALGKPFFSGDQPLWGETALMVAQRVGLGLEGRTQWEASYRRYLSGQPDDPKATVFGVGAYCIAIYADAQDHPTSALIAFANDGDYRGQGKIVADLEELDRRLYNSPGDASQIRNDWRNKMAEAEATFEPVRQLEQQSLTDKLTSLFGAPQQTSFGSDPTTKEDSLRWDWNGASFLLTCHPNKYDLLRIVPTALADNNGHTARISRDDIGHRLSGAVEHRENGDVVITQLPMANQGPKGYCVPATWERVLRYTGVPGDMYTLSRIGSAHFGGGESGLRVAQQLDKTLYDYGRHVEILHPTHLDYISVRHYIDDGVPVFWALNPRGYEPAEQRYSLADRSKDFDTWKRLLAQARSTPDKNPLPSDAGGHQVLLIGYNPDTKEIAWTDPWGRETKERWMTQEEALRCTLGEYYIITW